MSKGPSRPFAEVAPLAVELLRLLEPAWERIRVAGSLRRRRSWVSDIELVVEPRVEEVRTIESGLFEAIERVDLVDRTEEAIERVDLVDRTEEAIARLVDEGTFARREVVVHRADLTEEIQERDGPRYKALVYRGVPLDVFIVRPPAQWGCVFTIRTGPADFAQELVTRIRRHGRRVEDGRLLSPLGATIDTPEEADFFRECGQRWLEPKDRAVERVRIDPALWQAVPA